MTLIPIKHNFIHRSNRNKTENPRNTIKVKSIQLYYAIKKMVLIE